MPRKPARKDAAPRSPAEVEERPEQMEMREATVSAAQGLEDHDPHVHGTNLAKKEIHKNKYTDDKSRQQLSEIRAKYNAWRAANEALKGPTTKPNPDDAKIVENRVGLLTEYKDFIDQQTYAENFDSRSTLHSSVLEEFMYYLFKDLVSAFPGKPLLGRSATFKDLFFFPRSYEAMVSAPHARVETKDHDFVIGATIEATFKNRGTTNPEIIPLEVPAVAIECKTYLDKTMLEGSSGAAEQLKHRNPNALYIVAMEWLKLTSDVNLRKYKVDQIYVFRRQRNTDREYRFDDGYVKKPLAPDVVFHMFSMVREHLTKTWGGGIGEGLERGWLIGP